MEIFGAAIAAIDVTSRASIGIWRLCQVWKDAPEDVFQLSDDVDQAERFFCMLKAGIAEGCDSSDPHTFASAEEVIELLNQGRETAKNLHEIIDELTHERQPEKPSSNVHLRTKSNRRARGNCYGCGE
jgi:hypothetical protein